MIALGMALPLPAGAQPSSIPTVVVEARPWPVTFPAEGVVEARQQATLAAQVQGRVVELRVDAGSPVRRGEVLLRIDPVQASQGVAGAEASVAQAQANAINAQAQYQRTRSLVAQKFISQAALDQSEAAVKAAQAQLAAAQAGRGAAAATLGFTTITAPLDGVVSARHVEFGEMAQPGTPLLTVHDPASLRVGADIPQYRWPALQAGTLVARVALPDGRWLEGAPVSVLPAADPRTHTLRIRVDLPPALPGLAPGMAARVYLQTGAATPRLAVPAEAVVRRGEVTGVYVADAQGRFLLRQIRPGEPVGDGLVEVLSGLVGGETVATDGVRAGIAARPGR